MSKRTPNSTVDRHAADNYPTPLWCVWRLLDEYGPHILGHNLVEPCTGEGAIVLAMLRWLRSQTVWPSIPHNTQPWWLLNEPREEAHGRLLRVLAAYDKDPMPQFASRDARDLWRDIPPDMSMIVKLEDRYDSYSPRPLFLSNPPYDISLPIAEALVETGLPTIMLLPLNWLASASRYEFISANFPTLAVLPNRPNFRADKKSGAAVEYSWFMWNCPWAVPCVLAPTPIAERKASTLAALELAFGPAAEGVDT